MHCSSLLAKAYLMDPATVLIKFHTKSKRGAYESASPRSSVHLALHCCKCGSVAEIDN